MVDPTVFIVDDDEAVRDSLRILLESNGFCVSCFASPDDFLRSGSAESLGCLLVDSNMPGMSGFDLVSTLNRSGTRLPTILMTGHADARTRELAQAAGFLAIIEKPFVDDAVVEAVRMALA